jgi:hypothetical protein
LLRYTVVVDDDDDDVVAAVVVVVVVVVVVAAAAAAVLSFRFIDYYLSRVHLPFIYFPLNINWLD